ncbi:hypothetical protein M5K25_002008 [Dendrobium thyrsiflorum]|uniref:Clp ATPase C-terminal domain-containing protein n=1 Tax=Dendrobium thyrsiflorum TaxID=117978 RepID=A0ABD0VRM0_DENTH
MEIDTKDILFICGGAFVGLEKTISERRKDSSIGFGAPVCANMAIGAPINAAVTSSLLESVESGDLIAFGLIPEFVGRFPIVVSLSGLTMDQLVQVLTEPKNALCKQYRKMFDMNNVKLHYSERALRLIAAKAIVKSTGARALRAILESILTDAILRSLRPPSPVDCSSLNLCDPPIVVSLDPRHSSIAVPPTSVSRQLRSHLLPPSLVDCCPSVDCGLFDLYRLLTIVSLTSVAHRLWSLRPPSPSDYSPSDLRRAPTTVDCSTLTNLLLLLVDNCIRHRVALHGNLLPLPVCISICYRSSSFSALRRRPRVGAVSECVRLSRPPIKAVTIPDAKTGIERVDAVVVDEEAVGSVDKPGCGAKILHGDGALESYLRKCRMKDAEGNADRLEGEVENRSEVASRAMRT